jgi:hypothetical protein
VSLCVWQGDATVGAALAEDKHIKGMWFTGSHATGRKIAAAAAPNMVRLNLELGGKDAAYVRADADVQKVQLPHAPPSLVRPLAVEGAPLRNRWLWAVAGSACESRGTLQTG